MADEQDMPRGKHFKPDGPAPDADASPAAETTPTPKHGGSPEATPIRDASGAPASSSENPYIRAMKRAETKRVATPRSSSARATTPRPSAEEPRPRSSTSRSSTRRPSTPRLGKVGEPVDREVAEEVRETRADRHRRNRYALAAGLLATVTVVALIVTIAMGGVPGAGAAESDGTAESSEQVETTAQAGSKHVVFDEPGDVTTGPTTVSLSAVGDNLIHTSVLNTADAAIGGVGDGTYDFKVCYEGIRDVIETHDINFIDIETPMGGDERGISGGDLTSVSGAPVFNTPSSDADDIADFGFNLATTATNHVNDQGYEGIEAMAETWAEHPEVVVAGSYTSEEDRGTIRTFEKNGITFAFLAYTLAVNDVLPADYPDYAIPFAEDDEIEADVERAKGMADMVIVAISWGAEHYTDIAPDQNKYAQLLANLDVDLVLGFHPHVIGPVKWVEGKDAQLKPTGHKTLVAYSVGNFIGGMMSPLNNVSGVFTCDFVRDDAGKVSVENPGWIPTIIHFSGGTGHRVYQYKDYSTELGYTHDVLASVGDVMQYAKDLTLQVIDPEVVDIDWGDGTSTS